MPHYVKLTANNSDTVTEGFGKMRGCGAAGTATGNLRARSAGKKCGDGG